MQSLRLLNPQDWFVTEVPARSSGGRVRRGASRALSEDEGLSRFLSSKVTVENIYDARPNVTRRGVTVAPISLSLSSPDDHRRIVAVRHASGALSFHAPDAAPLRRGGSRAGGQFTIHTTGNAPADGTRRGALSKAVRIFVLKVAGKIADAILPRAVAAWERKAWKSRKSRGGLEKGRCGHASAAPCPGQAESWAEWTRTFVPAWNVFERCGSLSRPRRYRLLRPRRADLWRRHLRLRSFFPEQGAAAERSGAGGGAAGKRYYLRRHHPFPRRFGAAQPRGTRRHAWSCRATVSDGTGSPCRLSLERHAAGDPRGHRAAIVLVRQSGGSFSRRSSDHGDIVGGRGHFLDRCAICLGARIGVDEHARSADPRSQRDPAAEGIVLLRARGRLPTWRQLGRAARRHGRGCIFWRRKRSRGAHCRRLVRRPRSDRKRRYSIRPHRRVRRGRKSAVGKRFHQSPEFLRCPGDSYFRCERNAEQAARTDTRGARRRRCAPHGRGRREAAARNAPTGTGASRACGRKKIVFRRPLSHLQRCVSYHCDPAAGGGQRPFLSDHGHLRRGESRGALQDQGR